MITKTYQHHVDPRYYNFLWTDPEYLTVEYTTDGEKVSVQNITAPPYLISSIVMRDGWFPLMAEVQESAKQNAEAITSSNLHPVMQQALQPFIKID